MTPKAMVRSWPVLPPRVRSESIALQQERPVIIKGEADYPGLLPPGAMLLSEGNAELSSLLPWASLDSWP